MKRLIPSVVFGLALLLLPGLAWAQQGTITGTVTEAETGNSLPGATIQIVGENTGAASDVDGQYQITGVPAGEQTLRVSFVGYQGQERTVNVPADGTVRANFQLRTSQAQMEEIVVSSYAVEEDVRVTGASEAVSGADIESQNVQNVSGALQGRASGIRITSQSGAPGSAFDVQVRGQASISGGQQPLYIIDGIQVGPENISNEGNLSPLAGLSPSDVESVQVLKDASATAIYGARAANGVVIIQTKGGGGETRVNFSSQVGAVSPLEEYNILSASEWVEHEFLKARNAGDSPADVADDFGIPSTNPDEVTGPDWYDQSTRTGITQSYQLSVSGGGERTNFRLSGSFERDKGQVIESFLNQTGLRANVQHDATDYLSLSSKVNLVQNKSRGTIGGGAFVNSPFWASYLIRPHLDVRNEEGDYNLPLSGGGAFNRNIVAQEDFNSQSTDGVQILGNVSATLSLTDWLSARTVFGLDFNDLSEKDRRDPRLPNNADIGGSAFVSDTREVGLNVSQTLNYDLSPGERHDVSGLFGAEYRRQREAFNGSDGEGFPLFEFQNLDNAANPVGVDEFETESRFLGFFGDAEYTYDDRYTGSLTLRYDGSSRFGEDSRYGLFGSVGGSWTISEEAFMEDVGFVEDLELRGSYGVLGNSDFQAAFGNFAARQLYGGGGEYSGVAGIEPASLGRSDLTWEESTQINIGLDYSVFGGRLSGSVDAFRNDTDQLLLGRDLPADSGFDTVLDNVGEIRNEGLEFSFNTVNIDRGDFRWDTEFNITFQRSEVLSLFDGREEIRNDQQPGGELYRVGEPLGQYEQVPWAGVNPANGRPLYEDENGNLTYFVGGQSAEQTYGNSQSDFYGGFGNTFSYAGLTLDVFFQYDYGRNTFNNDRYFIDGNFSFNHTENVTEDYWEEPGDVSERPLPWAGNRPGGSGYNSGFFSSSVYMEDASYIRLKQVRLSYSLPSSLLEGVGIQGITVYVNGSNLLTFTNYTGLDPEIVGTALAQYPNNQRISGGIDLTL
ncbi:SusC/RagA family TonB-linked outer membrane protein [Salinibacter grassmerensis]|uniref:SusC/RagA family TonB-linked outer membrane protein n=1 Tax=Salinibacter grassmerensis TaxID=3040353 RepID=UPI0021E70E41|nr:SusC/RagA family TonB-linked outer membrane protein [Salinibacter grassmerensis]